MAAVFQPPHEGDDFSGMAIPETLPALTEVELGILPRQPFEAHHRFRAAGHHGLADVSHQIVERRFTTDGAPAIPSTCQKFPGLEVWVDLQLGGHVLPHRLRRAGAARSGGVLLGGQGCLRGRFFREDAANAPLGDRIKARSLVQGCCNLGLGKPARSQVMSRKSCHDTNQGSPRSGDTPA